MSLVIILFFPSAASAQLTPLEAVPAVELTWQAPAAEERAYSMPLDASVPLEPLVPPSRALHAASEELAPKQSGAAEAGLSKLFDRSMMGAGAPEVFSLPFHPLTVNGGRKVVFDRSSLRSSIAVAQQALDEYRRNRDRAASFAAPIVEDPKDFFIRAYGLGQLLWTNTTIGPRISIEQVAAEGRRAATRWDSAALGARAAFDRFLQRVLELDGKSPNRIRKRVHEALLHASLFPAAAVASFFDRLLPPEYRSQVESFRRFRQARIVESFKREALELIRREEEAHPGPDRYNVAGVLVTGSLIYGSGLPDSDLDFFVLTYDGTSRHVRRFMERLEELRVQHGWPDWPDQKKHPGALPVDGYFASKLASQFESAVVSPNPAIEARFNSIAFSDPFYKTTRWQRLRHRLTEPFYRLFLRWALK